VSKNIKKSIVQQQAAGLASGLLLNNGFLDTSFIIFVLEIC